MRVAVVHNHPSGGAARATRGFGRQLARRHDVDVFTLATADEEFLPSADFASRVHVVPFVLRVPRRGLFFLNDLRRLQDLNRLEDAYRALARAIDRGGYDVVLASACRFLQSPSVLAYARTSCVYYCHEPPRRFLAAPHRPPPPRPRGYGRLHDALHAPATAALDRVVRERDRRNVARARVVVANSWFTAGLISTYYGRDAAVCYPGVDAVAYRVAERSGGYVLSVGAIERHKGFDFLIDAIATIDRGVRPPLLLIGNEANATVRDELARRAALRDVVLTIRAAVSEDELANAYANAAVFAYAPRYEPFGLAALEAMASALPVVAVAEGGVLESVTDGVTGLHAPRDARRFGEAIRRIMTDPALARALGGAARQDVLDRWTWDAVAAPLEVVLSEVAAQRAARAAARAAP